MFTGIVRATRWLGPFGTAVRRFAAGQAMRNLLGATFMSDPARTDDREVWRQRFMTTVVPEAAPMFRQVFGHPGTPPELLAQVQARTLIVAGEDELAAFEEVHSDLLEVQRVVPDARLVIIPGAGHMVLIEQPDTGTGAVAEFIRGVDAA
jgi:pimeloyl-ACP methyl ester carboxylesterase